MIYFRNHIKDRREMVDAFPSPKRYVSSALLDYNVELFSSEKLTCTTCVWTKVNSNQRENLHERKCTHHLCGSLCMLRGDVLLQGCLRETHFATVRTCERLGLLYRESVSSVIQVCKKESAIGFCLTGHIISDCCMIMRMSYKRCLP